MSASAPPAATPGRLAAALAAALGTGVLVALQTRINGDLGARLGDGFLAAFISFGSGLVILGLCVLVWRPGRDGIRRVAGALRSREIPWWLVFGGVGGAVFVLGQGLTVGLIGVALYTVAVVCGQTVSSLVLDHRGLALMPPRPATPKRVAGTMLAIIAVGIAMSDRITPGAPYGALVIPLVAGLLVGWQQAVNGQVRTVSGSALTATFGNFLVGTIVLGVALVVHIAVAGWHPQFPADAWLYTGGFVGCLFIAAQAVIVRTTGVLLMALGVLAGQLLASVLFDVLLPVSDDGLRVATAVGAALVLAAVVIASWPGRRGPARVTSAS